MKPLEIEGYSFVIRIQALVAFSSMVARVSFIFSVLACSPFHKSGGKSKKGGKEWESW